MSVTTYIYHLAKVEAWYSCCVRQFLTSGEKAAIASSVVSNRLILQNSGLAALFSMYLQLLL
jgi:hypothetical protein